MRKITTPAIGDELYGMLNELCDAARLHATAERNYPAGALYVVLEALRVQAENGDSRVAVYLQPAGAR